MIFTKKDGVDQKIMDEMHRGVTKWEGVGAYTNDETNVMVTMISKYEIHQMKQLVKSIDPKAFVILDEGCNVVNGNYEKRLT